MRSLWLSLVVAATLASMVDLSAQAGNPAIGTWKLNVAKSKYSPGPPPKSLMVKIEPAGQGIKVATEGVGADGARTGIQYTANYDGKDYPITGSPDLDMVSLKRIDARTAERTGKKGGKVVQTQRSAVSEDGKTFTNTTKGTNAQGQTVNNITVFEKQ